MTPEAYITSSILELYVMGSLEPEEMAKVEEMAHHHPEVLAAERDVLQARASESSELLALIAKPDFRLVNLKATEKHPEASALVAWNPGSAEVYLWANDLAQPGADQKYQLWAIVDG